MFSHLATHGVWNSEREFWRLGLMFIGHEMETLWSTHTELLETQFWALLRIASMILTHFKSCLHGSPVKF